MGNQWLSAQWLLLPQALLAIGNQRLISGLEEKLELLLSAKPHEPMFYPGLKVSWTLAVLFRFFLLFSWKLHQTIKYWWVWQLKGSSLWLWCMNLFQVLIISYETFRMHSSKFDKNGSCDLLICDEAHRLKNDQTLTNRVWDIIILKMIFICFWISLCHYLD